MKITHQLAGLTLGIVLLLAGAKAAFAQDPVISQTWVSGTVYDGSHNIVTSGSVTVHCGAFSQVVSIDSSGNYGAVFQQSQCKAGDTAAASASTSEGSGSNSGTVQNTAINGPTVDLDISVLDIFVPEFGAVGAVMSALGLGAGYMMMKRKAEVAA